MIKTIQYYYNNEEILNTKFKLSVIKIHNSVCGMRAHGTFAGENQNQIDLENSIVINMRARARAKYELALTCKLYYLYACTGASHNFNFINKTHLK